MPGWRPHETEIGAQIGEALPVIARHAAKERKFAVHDFVMRDRQDEIFRKRVDQAKGHLVVMVASVDRIFLHVMQRVVHPAHIPFMGEAEPAFGRAARLTPGQAVDSSAISSAPGQRSLIMLESSCRKLMDSRFSRPPYWLGIHSPSLRE